MFRQFTNQQILANRLKRLAYEAKVRNPDDRAAKQVALEAISRFERCGWHPAAFELALDQATPGEFSFDAEGSPTFGGRDVWDAVVRVVDRYEQIMGGDQAVQQEPLFSTEKAAEYLGITIDTLKYHVQRKKNLRPFQKLGRDLAFTREQLDEFKRTKRGPGRPTTRRDE